MWGEELKAIRTFCLVIALAVTLATSSVQAQGPSDQRPPQNHRNNHGNLGVGDVSLLTSDPQQPSTTQTGTATNGKSSPPDAPTPKPNPAEAANPNEQYGKQPKRILWVVPNYRAVSANTHLPPLSFKSELWLATQDTFDYSDFIFVGGLAGVAMAEKSQPTFGQGAEGYGKYYWHVFVDGAIENYMTEAIVPSGDQRRPEILHHGQRRIL